MQAAALVCVVNDNFHLYIRTNLWLTLKLPVTRQKIVRALYYRDHASAVVGRRDRLVGRAAQFLDHAASRIRERLRIFHQMESQVYLSDGAGE